MPISPLYFQTKGAPLSSNGRNIQKTLPAELLSIILNDHASFGDLARLANVQKGWSNLLFDSVHGDAEQEWELARSLLDGTNGLLPNATAAVDMLLRLTEVSVNAETQAPVVPTDFCPRTPYAAKAMVALAHLHLQDGPHKALATGLEWLKAAFHAGDVEAANNVAVIHEYGLYGAEIDVVAAAEWLELAALAGHTESMAELGLCYELGCGVDVDDAVAMEWYVKAAEAGHVTAKYAVGEAFEEARGVPQSDAEACLWYYRAALEGDEDSLKALRRLHDIARIVVPGVSVLLDD